MWVPCLANWWMFWIQAYDHQVSQGVDFRKASMNAGKMLAHATAKQWERARNK